MYLYDLIEKLNKLVLEYSELGNRPIKIVLTEKETGKNIFVNLKRVSYCGSVDGLNLSLQAEFSQEDIS